MPILRSLLIGILTVGVMMGLFLVSTPYVYQHYLAGLPGLPPVYSYTLIVAISRLSWAWVGLSIVGWHVWHTWRLDRTTRAGVVAEVLMLLQYVFWLVLVLVLQMYLGWLSQGAIR